MGKPKEVPSHRRHKNRKQCAYCGVTLTSTGHGVGVPSRFASQSAQDNWRWDGRSWDHVVPKSVGGSLLVPSCCWCNSKKGDMSLKDWLASQELTLRRSMVAQREPDAEPMDPSLLRGLLAEDLRRIRKNLEYHSK